MPSSRGLYLQTWIYRYILLNKVTLQELSFLRHRTWFKMTEKLLLGENCDEQLFSRNIQEKDDVGYGHIVGVVFATIVIIGILFAAWMYHRRRVTDLKSEIAQVQYTAEPVSPPGKLSVFYSWSKVYLSNFTLTEEQGSLKYYFCRRTKPIRQSSVCVSRFLEVRWWHYYLAEQLPIPK